MSRPVPDRRMRQDRRDGQPPGITILNTLGGALKHYSDELEATISSAGSSHALRINILEPSSSGKSRLAWVSAYLTSLMRLRRDRQKRDLLFVTWPVLGFVDVLILRLAYGSGWTLVIHDPQPLVFGLGYDRFSKTLARLALGGNRLIVHSSIAGETLSSAMPSAQIDNLPHPMMRPVDNRDRLSDDAHQDGRSATIRVLGQYKADRDIGLLRDIAAISPGTMHFEIIGRGWPSVAGWNVHSQFVSEPELATAINDSDVVLIPYRRFYQSGIAIRCFESGVPVVGPRGSSLEELVHGADAYLADEGAARWLAAIQDWVRLGRSAALVSAKEIHDDTVARWAEWIATVRARRTTS